MKGEVKQIKGETDIMREKAALLDEMIAFLENECVKCDQAGFHPCPSCGSYKWIKRAHDIKN